MIRIITYLLFSFFSVLHTNAQITSEEITLHNNEIELPGTLTFSQPKCPLIIWVHGSGNVDRNGNQNPIIKANYIKQFRDSINKNNIAFFSFDKRTANKKNIPSLLNGVNFIDYASDVQKVIAHFKKDTRFTKITLIGHSQGSLVAMLSAKNIDKFISIAGPSINADKVILKQIHEKAPFLDSITKAHFNELTKTGKIKEVNPMLVSIFAKQNQSFLNSWIQYNPSLEIKKLTIPILILNGTKDLQVQDSEAKTLHEAAKNSKLILIDKMNHVLKEINSLTENQSSYLKPEYPLSSKLIKSITTFIKE